MCRKNLSLFTRRNIFPQAMYCEYEISEGTHQKQLAIPNKWSRNQNTFFSSVFSVKCEMIKPVTGRANRKMAPNSQGRRPLRSGREHTLWTRQA